MMSDHVRTNSLLASHFVRSFCTSNNLHCPPIIFLYTDGGPDNRITYLSVQLTLVSVFLILDLDFLCACRTAPAPLWKNPVERVMSILNLGLQSIGLKRQVSTPATEAALKNYNSL